jgi:superfamily II DNA or RNA helicase
VARLEQLQPGVQVKGIIPNQAVTIVSIKRRGADAVEAYYTQANGQPGTVLLYREDEALLELVTSSRQHRFQGDGGMLRLISEAYRIHLAHLFDPVLAVHTSLIDPLPHQITAVYGEMLPRQPLRYLLADDPGSGKTIMAGLLIKELMIRGDVRRCLICVPGNLTLQWQEELSSKFQLLFHTLTRDTIDSSSSGNPFLDHDLLIVRLDQVSRSEALQAQLRQTEWDLAICDEAHKMSASFFSGEVRETKRYKFGRLLSDLARHFLLMTATPHNGKEEDFQRFMALLDADRFEGRFRDGAHQVDTSDLMRRMVKEKLLKFDGKPLFPERKAYTIDYNLSPEEEALYDAVTDYVRQEFNRADSLQQHGRKGTVGFALTVLQRRLASSPEAIYQSLQRRRKRLEKRLQEERQAKSRVDAAAQLSMFDEDDFEDYLTDLEDAPDEEIEAFEAEVVDSATAAQTIAELEAEIAILRHLETMAAGVRRSGHDRKWEELRTLMQTHQEMVDQERGRRKLVIFTEHRDTLNYLYERLSTLLGGADMLTVIHGSLARQERKTAEDEFRNHPGKLVMLATDAAGEGINLQRAHLMVNYDLPWNPNRLEQRFGRIHRIGQTEVCHLWNLVAGDTREGHVYQRLLRKLEIERNALDGQVFDVLGKLFEDTSLRNLLIEAIRYGDRPDVRARLDEAIDNTLDRERVRDLLEKKSLAEGVMDVEHILRIRAEMERAAARRLQPFYIKAFFLQAFEHLGGAIYPREGGRYEITRVPIVIRDRARLIGIGGAVGSKYERVCFEKGQISLPDKPPASFICPGHPLLDAIISLMLERHRDLLSEGAILIDPTDPGQSPRVLFYLEQNLHDATPLKDGGRRVISREVHFVEIEADGTTRGAGSSPYLDYRPPTPEEQDKLRTLLGDGVDADSLEDDVIAHAVQQLVPEHLTRVRSRREALINKTLAAVRERLTKEIRFWDRRARELKELEQAGRPNAKINSAKARARADELAERLKRRMEELELERQVSASPPVIIGRALVVPIGALLDDVPQAMLDRQITEQIAMQAVMEREIALGHDPQDVSRAKKGYDIESRDGITGRLRFIEVKGRRAGADTVTITCNEIRTALNAGESYILALVEIDGASPSLPVYIRQPFRKHPDDSAASVNYNVKDLQLMSE